MGSTVSGAVAASLETRFTCFLEGLPGAEVIDKLDLPVDPERRRKADFLLAQRQVIVELKTLTTDTSHKIEAIADQHRDRDEWPLFYGKADVQKVLSNLPDGDAIYAKMINAIGRSVEDALKSAEEQVAHTKHVLKLSDAASLLVILNDSVEILDPYVVGHRVAQRLRRPLSDANSPGRLDFVWLLFESHSMGYVQGRPAMPCILIAGKGAHRFPWFAAFHKDVVHRWTQANGGIMVEQDIPDPSTIRFTSMKVATASPPEMLPRHEVWRRQYHRAPYLRPLSDDGLLQRGAEIIRQVLPFMVHGGHGYVPEVVNPLMEHFTHFLEEMNFRGLDMRRIPRL